MNCHRDERYTIIEMVKWLATLPPAAKITPMLGDPHNNYSSLALTVCKGGETTVAEALLQLLNLMGGTTDGLRVVDYTTMTVNMNGRDPAAYFNLNPTRFKVSNERIISLRGGRVSVERIDHTIVVRAYGVVTEYKGQTGIVAMFDEIYSRQHPS